MRALIKNICFVISAAAYIVLAVPAELKWILIGIIGIFNIYIVTRFIPDIFEFVKKYKTKKRIISAIALSMILGFRFEKVWRYSRYVKRISEFINMPSEKLLYFIGTVLGLLGIYFCLTATIFLLEYPTKLHKKEIRNEKIKLDKKLLSGICLVVIIQACVLIFLGNQKEGYHVDEVYTYELSNYQFTNYGDTENSYDNWITGESLKTIVEPDEAELFNLTIPYWNSEADVHPMIYYSVIHIISSLFTVMNIGINKWIGLIPNILFCTATTAILIMLMYNLTNKKSISIISVLFWAFSIGGLNTAVYIRMYAMLTFWCVLLIYLHSIFFLKTETDDNILYAMMFCTLFGALTQYYFLIFAFFVCATTVLRLLIAKRWQLRTRYAVTEICGITLAELYFPRMMIALFFGSRGKEALENAVNANIFHKLNLVSEIIDNELFAGLGKNILVICIILLILSVIVKYTRRAKIILKISDVFVIQVWIVTICFILVIAKLAPYMTDRYFMCSFPFLSMTVVYFLYTVISNLTNKIINGNWVISAIVAFTFIIAISGYRTQKINYIYKEQIERNIILQQSGDIPVVVLNADHYDDSLLKWVFELQRYSNIYLCHHHEFSNIKNANINGALDNGFLLYAHMYSEKDNVIKEVEKYIDLKTNKLLTDKLGCLVYYCE